MKILTDIKKWFESGALVTIIATILVILLVVLILVYAEIDTADYFLDDGQLIRLSARWYTISDNEAEMIIPSSVGTEALLRFESYFHPARIYLDDELILETFYNDETSCVYNYWLTLHSCANRTLRLETDSPADMQAILNGSSAIGPASDIYSDFLIETSYAAFYFIFSVAAAVFIGFLMKGLTRDTSIFSSNHIFYLLIYVIISATTILTDSQLPSVLGLNSDAISVLNIVSTGLMAPTIFHFVMSFYNRYDRMARTYIILMDSFVILNLTLALLFGLPLFRFLTVFHAIMIISIIVASGVIFKELEYNPTSENRLFAAAVITLILGSACSIICYYFAPARTYNIMFTLTMLVFISILITIVFRNMQTRINASEVDRRRALALARDNAESIGNAKTALVRSISYGIRMPMNAVQGYVSLAKAHTDEPEYLSECLDKADSAGHQVIELLDEMLNVYRTESGRLEILVEPVDIVHTFREITSEISEAQKDKSVRCSFDVSYVTNRAVLIDKAYFAGLLRTLMNNAFKHTGSGGIIYCELKQEASPNVGYSGFSLTVSDNGEGMTREELDLINSDTERSPESVITNTWNTSMLMFIYKRIVRSLGGVMYIDSNPNEGTTITVSLDLRNAETSAVAENDSRQAVRGNTDAAAAVGSVKGKRVLVVDDNEQSLNILSDLLQDMGVEVETASDGSIAVEMVRNSPNGHYSLVLMDIVMPYMDGHRATGLIRSLGSKAKASVPIVGMSADVFDGGNSSAKLSGMQDMLYKPVGMKDLNKVILKYASEKKKK